MKITICPICGSDQIKVITGKMTFRTPKAEVTIPKVSRQRCANCGEQFFDHEANKVLDRYRGKVAPFKKHKLYAEPEMAAPMYVRDDNPETKKYGKRKSQSKKHK